MYIPQAPSGNEGGDERWLISYADMITLLTVVFIILFSMSNIELEKFKALAESMSNGMGATSKSTTLEPDESIGEDASTTPLDLGTTSGGESPSILFPEHQTPIQIFRFRRVMEGETDGHGLLEKLRDLLEHEARSEGEQLMQGFEHDERVAMRFTEQGIVLTFRDDRLLFGSGSAQMTPVFREVLAELGRELNRLPNEIEILGHTDDRPIASAQYPSNWELSAARAASVARQLIAGGLPRERVSVAGYADTRPLESNASEHGRDANRRVEIVIRRAYGSDSPASEEDPQQLVGPQLNPGLPVTGNGTGH
ncbi:flagellar motor protein MotB [bacterium]|nr:flagellar motor protein MotB [bacterium]